MSTRFFTNHGDQTLLRKFRGIFENNPDIERFDALIGYLRASSYFAVRPHLEKVPHIRILVGINVDAIMADYHRHGLLFLTDPTKALNEFKNELRADIQGAAYKQDIEGGIFQFVEDVISKKIQLRAHPTKRLHAKLYIFRPKGFNEHKPGAVITGSSNLTGAGLGKDEDSRNYEFNVLLHDYHDVCYATEEEQGFVEGLEQDWQKLAAFCDEWEKVEEDPKLDEFLRHLETELFDRQINHEGKKLVVFSESKETTSYLLGRLAHAGYRRVLTVSSENRAERMRTVRANFDGNAEDKANDYDILISTEVLAEGVNLHRSNVIVNYDTPWNSTRLMQRVGRVNRIGCVAPGIYIYNFYPTTCVDDDIELRKKAIMKLQAFHTALGEDSQIYSETEEVDTFGLFDRSPEEEERDERLALLMELRQFRQQHPEQFRRIKGLPLRARVGRADAPRANGTVTFIRSHRRDAFYRVRPNSEIEEIALLEAAREFRALDPAEKAIPLHAAHHEHVNTALDSFKEAVTTDALQSQTMDASQGPNERKALQYLDSFLSLPFMNEDERHWIRAAQAAIRRARFQNLQRQVNQLYRSTKDVKLTPSALADKLMQILRTYPLDAPSADTPSAPVQLRPLDTTPEIILSESFDHPLRP